MTRLPKMRRKGEVVAVVVGGVASLLIGIADLRSSPGGWGIARSILLIVGGAILLDLATRARADTQETRTRHIGAPLAVLSIVGAIAALTFLGFFSGLPILLALLAVRRSTRSGDTLARRLSWGALAIAVAAFAFACWMWQWFLWDMHYHPGAGGPIPPPSVLNLAFMPLIAAGLTLLALVLALVARRFIRFTPRT
jgi:hypothetical protein